MTPPLSAREQFDKNAEKYLRAPLFATGDDLRRLVESLALTGTEHVLDLGTGAGHVALTVAHSAAHCFGIDVSERMIEVATDAARRRGVENVRFTIGDAEKLPFAEATFDVVTCRFAAHHFSDPEKAVAEISRVLVPGGTLAIVDHYAPDDPELDVFVNELDRMRDRSHMREQTLREWQELFAHYGLDYHVVRTWDLPLGFADWLERAGTPEDTRRRIVSYLRVASPRCRETFRVELDDGGNPSSFCLKAALFHGTKQHNSPNPSLAR